MPDITLILPDGQAEGFEAPDGVSLMQAATGRGIDGIVAECGGSGICATCHVIVDAGWIDRLPPPGPDEATLLELVAVGRQPGSRLSCQVRLGPELQGLLATVPERQY